VTETVSETAPAAAAQADSVITVAGLGEASKDAEYPACDGRAILILDSVVDEGNGGAALPAIARQVLMAHPSGKPVQFTVPGACPSLRAQLDGQNIYPVYLDTAPMSTQCAGPRPPTAATEGSSATRRSTLIPASPGAI